jgi:chromate transporter
MNPLLLYLLMVKATLSTFTGLASLPIVRNDLVVERGVLTDRELNAAVAAGRTSPGPHGSYLVSVGYFVAGFPGACAGLMAVITPAFLIIPMLRYLGRRAAHPTVRSIIETVILAAAGLIVSATIPLGRESVTNWGTLAIACGGFIALAFTRLPVLGVIAASAAAGLFLA